jgi:chorismate mutase
MRSGIVLPQLRQFIQIQEDSDVGWQTKAIRGATTAKANTPEAMRAAVMELLDELEKRNSIDPDTIVSVIFSTTKDLDAIFPAQIARETRPSWDGVALMDLQQMHVQGSLPLCIRFLIHANLPVGAKVEHIYLQGAVKLRPDLFSAPLPQVV